MLGSVSILLGIVELGQSQWAVTSLQPDFPARAARTESLRTYYYL